MLRAKYREWMLARKIEKKYGKHEIIRLYLNTVPFGDNVYGVATASRHYFNKPINELELHQHALLVGVLKGNSVYHPRRHPQQAKNRRNTVLSLLKANGFIDESAFSYWVAKDLDVLADGPDAYPVNGYALEHIKSEAKQILGDKYDIYIDGLTIVSTIDANLTVRFHQFMIDHLFASQSRMSIHALKPGVVSQLKDQLRQTEPYKTMSKSAFEEALTSSEDRTVVNHLGDADHIEGTPLDSIAHQYTLLKAGALVLDTRTAAVRLYVGGHHARLHPYDHVRSARQVASTFKPIVALTALKQGISRCTYFPNTIPDTATNMGWLPKNSNQSDSGFYSLQGALIHSMNLPFVHLGFDVGLDNVVQQAIELGWTKPLNSDPSILLGSAENSLWEMTSIYARLQNENLAEPFFIDAIYDQDGSIIYSRKENEQAKLTSEPTHSDTLLNILANVSKRGTAKGLHGHWAAKTGTSNRGSDSWTMACNQDYAFGIWVGGSNPNAVTGGSSNWLALPLAIEMSSLLPIGTAPTLNDECVDFLSELPEEKRGFFDFLKRKKKPSDEENDKKKKKKKNLLQRIFGK